MVLENNESIYKILLPDIHSTKDYINYNLFSLTKAKERIGLSDENKKKLTKMYVNNINEALKLYNELY
jgi:4'-phosphopantetheinyl transferase EntD